jgi:ribulose-phosphate 3-epimerase
MSSIIAPCITVETLEQYQAAVEKLKPFAQRVQIDISDGEFAPVLLLGIDQMQWPPEWIIDIHAMVMRPMEYVDKLIALKPHLIIFHAETGIDLVPIMEKIKNAGIKAGVALLRPTVPATVVDEIKAADHVLVFSGDLGHYGGTASMMQLEKVRLIKNINPNVEVGWDGGVNVDNAFTLARGGVDVLNVGGAINNVDNPASAYDKLMQEINKQGVI